MKRFIKPNWKKSIINISATLAEFLGAPNNKATLPILKKELQKNYKNIVFICFDGLGNNPLKQNLSKDDFLIRHIKQKLTSTFPSTTTNATTTLITNTYPLEHGWCGWSMNFESLNKNIDLFRSKDSWTGEYVNIENSPIPDIDYYFDNAKTDYRINTVFPTKIHKNVKDEKNNNEFEDNSDMYKIIKRICSRKDKQFVYAYYTEPDYTMHTFGVKSDETKKVLSEISKSMEELANKTKDTLFVITADHGQTDIKGYIEFYKDEKLYSMLKIYPYLDSRALAFKVKEGNKDEFKKYFNSKYKKDFKLYETKKIIKKGIFGLGGDKANLLGDYIAIGTYTNKQAVITPISNKYKGHHTSLTNEMLVPLIIINN